MIVCVCVFVCVHARDFVSVCVRAVHRQALCQELPHVRRDVQKPTAGPALLRALSRRRQRRPYGPPLLGGMSAKERSGTRGVCVCMCTACCVCVCCVCGCACARAHACVRACAVRVHECARARVRACGARGGYRLLDIGGRDPRPRPGSESPARILRIGTVTVGHGPGPGPWPGPRAGPGARGTTERAPSPAEKSESPGSLRRPVTSESPPAGP